MKILFIFVLFFTSFAFSEETSKLDARIGFVNIRSIIQEAPQIHNIQKKLEKDFESENKKIIKLRQDIQSINQSIRNETDEKKAFESQKEIGQKQRELTRLQESLQDEYSLRRNEELGKLQSLIVKIVAEVSKEKRLDIVLNNTGVIYVNSRIDITPDVMKKLQQQEIQ